jgi:UPF0271 protein
MTAVIDINADLGEGGNFDRELLTLVSSANISCGAHAGTEHNIRQAIVWAMAHNVAIGAHPSYPDKEHWGRRSLSITGAELYKSLLSQLQWLQTLVHEHGGHLQHVKPHGALYNDAAKNLQLAELIARCVKDFDPSLILVGLAGGKALEAGQRAGLRVCAEAFVDRRYQANGTLLARIDKRALISDAAEAIQQALSLATGSAISAYDGSSITIQADTLCIHGDSAQALEFATQLHSSLLAHGFVIRRLS